MFYNAKCKTRNYDTRNKKHTERLHEQRDSL